MRYPKDLQPNGTIGLVAPSYGCASEPYRTAFEQAQRKWREMGYQLDPGPNCYLEQGVGISNTPKECGRELTEYYCSPKNDCLISCGGGELMCEILDEVDFDRIQKAAPKWYMGYSDNTNFTFLLTTLCDTASLYGPCAASFGMEPWHACITDAFALLCGKKHCFTSYGLWEKDKQKDEEHPLAPYYCTEKQVIRIFEADSAGVRREKESALAEGRLLGGCLDCLVNLIGTKFDQAGAFAERYRKDGILWFLEACDLNPFAIRRAMWQMEQAGWFRYVKGFLIGRPLAAMEDCFGLDRFDAFMAVTDHYRVPVFMDVDLGHLPPAMPLVTGSLAKIRGEENRLQVSMTFQ